MNKLATTAQTITFLTLVLLCSTIRSENTPTPWHMDRETYDQIDQDELAFDDAQEPTRNEFDKPTGFDQAIDDLAKKLEIDDPVTVLKQFNQNKEALAARCTPVEIDYMTGVIALALDNVLFSSQRAAFQYAAQGEMKKAELIAQSLEAMAQQLEPIDSVRAAYMHELVKKNIASAIALGMQRP